MNEEAWKVIPSWPEYECSSLGRIRRIKAAFGTKPGRILKAPVASNGYRIVNLSRNSKVTTLCVHRIVANTFIGDIPTGMYVCHGDGDKLNNTVGNLRIDTPLGNSRDQILHGTTNRGEKCPHSKLTQDMVREIRARVSSGEQQKDVAKDYGISASNVWQILNNNWKWVK